jgi:hypothetical protein
MAPSYPFAIYKKLYFPMQISTPVQVANDGSKQNSALMLGPKQKCLTSIGKLDYKAMLSITA